jgi:hypothetical protein
MLIRDELIRRKRPYAWGMAICIGLALSLLFSSWQLLPMWLVYCGYGVVLLLLVLAIASSFVPKCPRCQAVIPFNLPLRKYPGTRKINNCPYCGHSFDQIHQP